MPLGRVSLSTEKVAEIVFFELKNEMWSRTPSRARRPVWNNPGRQLPGTGICGDGENFTKEFQVKECLNCCSKVTVSPL